MKKRNGSGYSHYIFNGFNKALSRSLVIIMLLTLCLSSPAYSKAKANPTPVSAAVGLYHNLLIKSDGSVWAWGQNSGGKLGIGTLIDQPSPVKVSKLSNITQIAAGDHYSIALKKDGTLWTWGYSPSKEDSYIPTKVEGINNVVKISSGSDHCVALEKDGTVWVWGNSNGFIGSSLSTDTEKPTKINYIKSESNAKIMLKDVKNVAAGRNATLIQTKDGSTWAIGSAYSNKTARKLKFFSNVKQYSVNSARILAVLNNGTVWCLKNGEKNIKQIKSLNNIKEIADNGISILALKSDGRLYSLGHKVGSDTTFDNSSKKDLTLQTPTVVDKNISHIYANAGYYNSSKNPGDPGRIIAIKKDNSLWAWGNGRFSSLGNGETPEYSSEPSKVQDLSKVKQILSNAEYSAALKSDGTVWVWGATYYPSDNPPIDNPPHTNKPCKINNLTDVISIGEDFALKKDGTVWVWTPYAEAYTAAGAEGVTNIKYYGSIDYYMFGRTMPGFYYPGKRELLLKNDGSLWISEYEAGIYKIEGISDVDSVLTEGHYTVVKKTDGSTWMIDASRKDDPLGIIEIDTPDNITSLFDTNTLRNYFVKFNDDKVWKLDFSSYKAELTELKGLKGMTYISNYGKSGVGIKKDGSVWEWKDEAGMENPIKVNISNVISVCKGNNFTLALKKDGTVWSWGDNLLGQLGREINWYQNKPVKVKLK